MFLVNKLVQNLLILCNQFLYLPDPHRLQQVQLLQEQLLTVLEEVVLVAVCEGLEGTGIDCKVLTNFGLVCLLETFWLTDVCLDSMVILLEFGVLLTLLVD
jgi:hypothetical protein